LKAQTSSPKWKKHTRDKNNTF